MSTKRDFIETERTPGWAHYTGLVGDAIKALEIDLATLDTDSKSADQIGLEHVRITERIAGLKQALGVAEDIKKEEADDL